MSKRSSRRAREQSDRIVSFSGLFCLSDASTRLKLDTLNGTLNRLREFYDESPTFRPTSIYIDLEDVTEASVATVLFLGAIVDRHCSRRLRVAGNLPRNNLARSAFFAVGFQNFMRSSRDRVKLRWDVNGLAMRAIPTGGTLDPEKWWPLHDLLEKVTNDDESELLYNALSECIENVRHHAYDDAAGLKWYAMAQVSHVPGAPRATVVIADVGVTIPKSLKKLTRDPILAMAICYAEVAQMIASSAAPDDETEEETKFTHLAAFEAGNIGKNPDWWLVWLASMGWRTETGEAKRGVGLNWLRQTVARIMNARLHVHSAGAHLCYSGAALGGPAVLPTIPGTVVILELW